MVHCRTLQQWKGWIRDLQDYYKDYYKDYYSHDLQAVLDAFNAITEENALMRKREREIWGEGRKKGTG